MTRIQQQLFCCLRFAYSVNMIEDARIYICGLEEAGVSRENTLAATDRHTDDLHKSRIPIIHHQRRDVMFHGHYSCLQCGLHLEQPVVRRRAGRVTVGWRAFRGGASGSSCGGLLSSNPLGRRVRSQQLISSSPASGFYKRSCFLSRFLQTGLLDGTWSAGRLHLSGPDQGLSERET